ncbi:hypothetical protein VTO73DRAFT_8068 [Trametes versicolor]
MTPEEHSVVESIQTLLAQIKEQTRSIISHEAFVRVTQLMFSATTDLCEVSNARRPLLSMPTELLQNIMAFIPDAEVAPSSNVLPPIWHAAVYNTVMIIPISQTCRRLRQVALGCPTLWTSLTDGPPALARRRARIFAQRSQTAPLKVYLPIGRGDRAYDLTDIVEGSPSLPWPVQELHVADLPSYNTKEDLERLFAARPVPLLESLSVQFCDNPLNHEDQYHFGVPGLMPEHVPRLRRLYLGSCDLVNRDIMGSLTHLALHSIAVNHVHKKIESILSACLVLESLHLEQIEDLFSPPEPPPEEVTVHEFYHRKPRALPSCRRLRRVTLLKMYGYLASFIVSLVLSDQRGLALQLHGIKTSPNPQLPDDLLIGTSQLAIGRYLCRCDLYRSIPWGITAVTPERTFHSSAAALEDATAPLGSDGPLMSVHELWLVDLPSAGPDEEDVPPEDLDAALMLKATIESMPALETVVLANHIQLAWMSTARPSLHLLPDIRSAVSWPSISTLRIVYGYGPDVQDPRSLPVDMHALVPPLDLTALLEELASGAYDYLEHLVLEIPPFFRVDPRDIERLRGNFETAEVRVVDKMPGIALPEYCVEPEVRPGDAGMSWSCRL